MGWLFSFRTRSELIRDLTRPEDQARAHVRVIAHTLRGNVLWSVSEVTAKTEGVHPGLAPGESMRYIRCDLLQRRGGEWGYKAMDESMAPYYYSCPLRYLDLAKELSPAWRDKVRAHHARRRQSATATAGAVAQ
ncbi:hypothetical protein ABL975_25980 [Pseudomonas aeruginosa]|uniref:hypothetical protein n=1 Tax=Pseudomonas aeruginosa TaxID=287 RepID=UPI0005AB2085|nr:hypothetical protein [Pseudomonas aeruginosa]QMX83953.1 hypothetical protein H5J27_12405 [Pseudomonas aeruginosa]RPP76491.1 hypothetical protein IPC1152_18585 [Pseudomonas aeruginosa]UEG10159.1 hypothetical protein LKM46_21045 [Pseudomonas aeruginosa]HCD9750883.1 hypothetical protein [Pseudomonas aeruginosa]HCE3962832.1 hypothetical protein [Pseudomonas aeruginosa]